MSECKHEYLLDVQGGFYYCPNCPDEWTIQDLLRANIENQERIKALEGVVEAVKGCSHYLEEEGYCEGCDKGHKGQSWHNKWCNIGKLVEALSETEKVSDKSNQSEMEKQDG